METETTFLVPTGDGKSSLILDLKDIIMAEQRLQDVATVNQQTASELLATFNDSWLKADKSVVTLTHHKAIAENKYREAQATARINCTDELIKQKGHSKASADLRAAYVELDPEVIATKERLDNICFILEVLRGKKQAFFNAYTSVKRLTDSRSLPPAPYSKPENRPPAPPSQVSSVSKPNFTELQPTADLDLQPLPPGFK